MKDFFKTLFACLIALGVFAGGVFVLFLAFVAAAGASKPSVPSRAVLVLDMDLSLMDHPDEGGAGEALRGALEGSGTRTLALASAVSAVDRAADDSRIAALYLTGNPRAGLAGLKELKAAVARFKAKKPVLAYNQEWGKQAYYLASGATTIFQDPSGALEANGFATEPMFFADLFRKYGVEVQVTRVGKYKSAVEPYILDRMSDANREQLQKLLGDLWGDWKASVAQDRHRSPEALQAVADEKGLLEPEEAKAAGLVDRVAHYDEVLEELKKLGGADRHEKTFNQIDLATYAGIEVSPRVSRNRVAVVYAEGEIVDGEGRPGQVGGDQVSRELRKLRTDDGVKAVVLRVNSPGGSAAASDLIQREVLLTRKLKPVVVSMGNYAASGGYLISASADRIFAEPNTLTGSIGVFGLLWNVQKLANEHGVTWDSVQTSKLASLGTLARPKNELELARIQGVVDHIYDQFVGLVAEGRHLSKERVHEIAQGRVWSGSEALKLGLVDEMGGLEEAVKFAASKASLGGDYQVDQPAAPRGLLQKLLEDMGKDGKPKAAQSAADRLLAEAEAPLRALRSMDGRTKVYARMPFDVTVK